jgi:hypothetical protein
MSVHRNIVCNSQKVNTTQNPSRDEYKNKMLSHLRTVLNRTSSFFPLEGVSDVLNRDQYPYGGIGIWPKGDLG